MADRSGIEWTDATCNPIRARDRRTGKIGWHCAKVSDGCTNCYSETMDRRLGTGEHYNAGAAVELFLDLDLLNAPLRWKRPRRIFWCSMTDLFLEQHPDEWITKCYWVMARTPQHTHIVLTKRPERMVDFHRRMVYPKWVPNLWIGTSVEDQRSAADRMASLRRVDAPAAVRFLSAEPLLAPIDFGSLVGIDWVIVGGESGPKARPCAIEWIDDLVRQCRLARVACFVKQLGSVPMMQETSWRAMASTPMLKAAKRPRVASGCVPLALNHSKGGDPAEWPADLRVREYPGWRRE